MSYVAAAAADRAEVDTARPFRSVKEAVAVFGERILISESHVKANANANANARHEASSSTSTTPPTNAMLGLELEPEPEPMPAIVPMYSAPSSPPSLASSQSANKDGGERGDQEEEVGLMIMSSIKKLESEVFETRQEVLQLKKRESEMELAVASLNAQLHRGLSKLAEMEAEKAAADHRSIGGDTDITVAFRSEQWGGNPGGHEYLPALGHAMSLGEIDEELIGKRRRVHKIKPIVPLIGDILFSKRKSTKDKGDSLYTDEFYSVLG